LKSFNKVITFTALLSMFLFFYGVNISHFNTSILKISEIIDTGRYDWHVWSIACAASEGKNPAGDDEINRGASSDQSDDSGIQEEGFITLLRIVSVAAMSMLLIWYIRKRMRL
jgi:hypothetical protein